MRALKRWLILMIGLLLAQSGLAVETGDAVVGLLRDTYRLEADSYEIEITANQLKTRLVDPADLSVRPLSQKEPLGPFTVLVEISSAGELVERGQIRLRIKRFAEVLVATDKVGRNEPLSERQFEVKRTDITSLREQPIQALADIAGQRSKRNLRVGNVLTTGAIEPVPDIEVGEEITIVYSDAWGSVTVPGRAMQAGWVGTRLRVKNLASGKVILAEVTDARSVEVNP